MIDIAYDAIIGCWLLFVIYWVVSASRLKAVAERQDWTASLAYKVPAILGGIMLGHPRFNTGPLQAQLTPQNEMTALAGAMLCIAGVGIAIWARRILAGNWSNNITFKQGHELVKTGPYRYARHPIYTGLLSMALGTALAGGRSCSWLGLLLFFIGFWIKLQAEEAVMLRHFPDQYPAYRREVKAIVPFVL